MRLCVPERARIGQGFSAARMGTAMFGREGDPVLNLDHFLMSSPTFPPHAHAGFSAVTYMLPGSPAGMRNRDSRGDASVIPPGGLHWTAAGAGIVHEEVPDRAGLTAEGFQIFVRQPVEQETAPPVIHHLEPGDLPLVRLPEGSARVLAGTFDGNTAPFAPPSPLTLLDISLAAAGSFAWAPPAEQSCCSIYLFAGRIDLDGRRFVAPALILLERDETQLTVTADEPARFLLMAGRPLDAPSVSNGPFVLSSPAALDEAVSRYRSGAMGTLY